ncbi:GAF domain-containing protein [Streptomyces sp. 5K101]|uniref:GAF domain-containing protein n=1 Tax=Streptomyces sp. 5K101 TaxID=3390037 RepID=UPI0039770970
MSQRSDLRRRRAALEDEWSRWVPRLRAARRYPGGGDALRPEVTESWVRSLSSVDPGRDSAPVSDGAAVHSRWAGSPLRRPVGDLGDELRSIAEDAGFVTAVTDECGTILWTCGGRTMQRRAEQVNFAPGGRWDEQAMGTNALSLALRTGRPSTVFSAEHLVTALHGWVCYCAPIHDPGGQVLGVLDLSTTWDRSHPLAMSTVRTLVSTIEARLRAGTTAPGRTVRLRLPGDAGGRAGRRTTGLAAASAGDLDAAGPGAGRLLAGTAARGAVRGPAGDGLHVQGGDLAPAARPVRRHRHPPVRPHHAGRLRRRRPDAGARER